MSKRKRIKKSIFRDRKKIDIEQILLYHRQIFLFGVIDDELANTINKQLIVLDKINHKPIVLRINSGGGSLSAGFSIIDTMNMLITPVITCITGYACSMAGLISIAGTLNNRVMTKYSVWMAHDMYAYNKNYATKMIDYTDYLKKEQKRLFEFLSQHSKLSQAELTKARNGELWYFAEEAKDRKSVV